MKTQEKYLIHVKHGLQEGIMTKLFEDKFFPAADTIQQQARKAYKRLFSTQSKAREEKFVEAFELGYNKANELQPYFQNETLKSYCIDKGYIKVS